MFLFISSYTVLNTNLFRKIVSHELGSPCMSSVFFQEEMVSNTHKMIVGTNNCGNEDNNYLIVLELATGTNDEPASLNVR